MGLCLVSVVCILVSIGVLLCVDIVVIFGVVVLFSWLGCEFVLRMVFELLFGEYDVVFFDCLFLFGVLILNVLMVVGEVFILL